MGASSRARCSRRRGRAITRSRRRRSRRCWRIRSADGTTQTHGCNAMRRIRRLRALALLLLAGLAGCIGLGVVWPQLALDAEYARLRYLADASTQSTVVDDHT